MRYTTFIYALIGVATAKPIIAPRTVGKIPARSVQSPVYDAGKHSIVTPGSVDNIIVTADNTLNGTFHSDKPSVQFKQAFTSFSSQGGNVSLPIHLINSFKNGAKAFISGKDDQGRLVFMKGNGDVYYPSSGGSKIPVPVSEEVVIPLPDVGQTLTIDLPMHMMSGRVWFGDEPLQFYVVKTPAGDGLVQPSPSNLKEPNGNIEWGFVEFTLDSHNNLYANPTYVDFVGVGAAIKISEANGQQQVTKGLPADSAAGICFGLGLIGSGESNEWSKSCVFGQDGKIRRVLSPNQLVKAGDPTLATYMDPYVDKVWKHYSSNDLNINTSIGAVTCRVSSSNNSLSCTGKEDLGFVKPTTPDIWACDGDTLPNSGSLLKRAIAARLCAAFWRATFLVNGGDSQPGPTVEQYYAAESSPAEQCGRYSEVIHSQEFDFGYAFPYDDVRPNGMPDQSGTIASNSATSFSVLIGGLPRP